MAKNTLHVPDHVPLEHAALTEPLACAVHGFEDSQPHTGDTVAVIGGGPLGLMILHVAALAGCEIIAIVKHDGQVEAARQLGAAHVVQTTSIRKAIRETRALTDKNRGVDIAIEAVGVPEAWQEAVEMVRKGGTVNFFGGAPSAPTSRSTPIASTTPTSPCAPPSTTPRPSAARRSISSPAAASRPAPSSPATPTSTSSTASSRS